MSHGISWGTATSVILIDADNTSPRVAAGLFEEPAKLSGPADLKHPLIFSDVISIS